MRGRSLTDIGIWFEWLRMRKGLWGSRNPKHGHKIVPVRTWRCLILKLPATLRSDPTAAQGTMDSSFPSCPLLRGSPPVCFPLDHEAWCPSSPPLLSSFWKFLGRLLPPDHLSPAL